MPIKSYLAYAQPGQLAALRQELGDRAVERVRQLFGLERFGDEVRTIVAACRQAL